MPDSFQLQEPTTKQLEQLAARLDQLIANAEATVRTTREEITQLEQNTPPLGIRTEDE